MIFFLRMMSSIRIICLFCRNFINAKIYWRDVETICSIVFIYSYASGIWIIFKASLISLSCEQWKQINTRPKDPSPNIYFLSSTYRYSNYFYRPLESGTLLLIIIDFGWSDIYLYNSSSGLSNITIECSFE